jgi:hypothetical protein
MDTSNIRAKLWETVTVQQEPNRVDLRAIPTGWMVEYYKEGDISRTEKVDDLKAFHVSGEQTEDWPLLRREELVTIARFVLHGCTYTGEDVYRTFERFCDKANEDPQFLLGILTSMEEDERDKEDDFGIALGLEGGKFAWQNDPNHPRNKNPSDGLKAVEEKLVDDALHFRKVARKHAEILGRKKEAEGK